MPEPEALARIDIDLLLEEAGWIVQDRDELNLFAGPGIDEVSIPPLAVQHEILDEIGRNFPVADQHESTSESNLKRTEVLRQPILRLAFSGKLL